MKQKEIYSADLGGSFSHQPVVIVSGDTMNTHAESVIVCPLLSGVQGLPGSVQLKKSKESGLPDDVDALAFQIRALPKKALGKKLGQMSAEEFGNLLVELGKILTY